MNKKIGIFAAAGIFISGVAAAFYLFGASSGSPQHYAFDIQTEDLSVRNIGWFAYGDSVYVDGAYYLQSEKPDASFEGVTLTTHIDDEPLLSFAQSDDPFKLPDAANGRYHLGSRGILHKPGIAPGDYLYIMMRYDIDGVSKTYRQAVPVHQLKARPSTMAEVIMMGREEPDS